MATLILEPVVEQDVERVMNFSLDAITDPDQGNPGGEFIAATWPNNNTLDGRKIAKTRWDNLFKALPPRSMMKVVDTQLNNKIVGVAVWLEYPKPPTQLPPLEGDFWPSEEEKKYAQHINIENSKVRLRRYASLQGPVITLLILCVAPEHQRRGIGSILVAEGIERAHRLGAAMTVDSTVQGLRCYEKHGFRVQESATLPLPPEWKHKPRHTVISMLRPKEGD